MSAHPIVTEIYEASRSPYLFEEQSVAARKRAGETIALYHQLRSRSVARVGDADCDRVAERLAHEIEACNRDLFDRYAEFFRRERGTSSLRRRMNRFTGYAGEVGFRHFVRDDLDLLLDGVLGYDVDALRLPKRSPDHTHLEAVPGSLIMDLVDHVPLDGSRRFVDLGSGLGHGMIFYALLAGRPCWGVELEQEYCERASAAFPRLGLDDLSVTHGDLLDFPLREGDLVFLFSPVSGRLFERLAKKLRDGPPKLEVCSGGSATLRLAHADGFRIHDEAMADPYRLAVFSVT